MSNAGKISIVFALMAAVLSACAVKEAPDAVERRAARGNTFAVRPGPAKCSQEGIAGVLDGDAKHAGGNVPPELSASHKTLPMNIMVSVRNKENGRQEIVRISERGPLVKGRIMDLSPLAARRLGFGESGAAVVKMEVLGFGSGSKSGKVAYRRPASCDEGKFTVQVMVFSDAAAARALAEKMRRLFGYAEIRATTEGGKRFYRVFAGQYVSRKEAESAERSFSEHGYPASFVLSVE